MLENADTATAFSLTKTFKTLTSRWSAHIVTLRLILPSKATPNESIFEMHTKVCVLKRASAKPQTPFSCLFAANPEICQWQPHGGRLIPDSSDRLCRLTLCLLRILFSAPVQTRGLFHDRRVRFGLLNLLPSRAQTGCLLSPISPALSCFVIRRG